MLGGHKKPKGASLLRKGEEKKESNKTRSAKHEARLASSVGARVQPNSGALPFASQKGDLSSESFLYQAKLTQGASFGISAALLAEIHKQAALVGKTPVVIVTAEGLPEQLPRDWVVVPLDTWREVVLIYQQEKGSP